MCGIAGAIGVPQAADTVRLLLHGLQNRGQQSFGLVSVDPQENFEFHHAGTVANDLPQHTLEPVSATVVIGHNRYATAPKSDGARNMQPFLRLVDQQPIAIAHNGNFTNADDIEKHELRGTPLDSQSDTERFFRLVLKLHKDKSMEAAVIEALGKMTGSCSAILATPRKLLAIRDSTGNRPLFWGRLNGGFLVASEDSALDALQVEAIEVAPGTIVTLWDTGDAEVSPPFGESKRRYCSFEWLYFGQITSTLNSIDIADIRKDFGRKLADEHPVEADVVLGIPDSGTLAGMGYAEKNLSGEFLTEGIIRRHNTGRTFIKAGQEKRERAVTEKFGFATNKLRGKRIVLVDDSLVRGTTSKRLTAELKQRGAAEVHWRIPSPEVRGPCHYGIATKAGEMLAEKYSLEGMRAQIGADSLQFLSMEGFKAVIEQHGVSRDDACFACMDKSYW